MILQYEPSHLSLFPLQDAQKGEVGMLDVNAAELLVEKSKGMAWTLVYGERIGACVGMIPIWSGRYEAWGFISGELGGPGMLAVHRDVKEILKFFTYRRIEMTVQTGFGAGARWAKMLGFTYEGTMQGWAPDGTDYDLFSLVRK